MHPEDEDELPPPPEGFGSADPKSRGCFSPPAHYQKPPQQEQTPPPYTNVMKDHNVDEPYTSSR
ncbi:hypothetical protein CMO91_05215 [Candidatus Woesearchaeota archaeon]|nr:hypothetical protein [Candidatus Woesearchaeota archaeon]|tara:strand:- start:496 stop:687 length:192 start_codon:yes stop_codon:yes gene_type:complete